jgi:hypothetical protein
MTKTSSLQVYLQLPDGPDRDALRVGLLALQCIPVNLATPGAALTEQLERLALDPQAVVFLDASNALPKVTHRFDHLLDTWPTALRARTVLTRLAAGHVNPVDRAWVKSLGFADLVASFEDTSSTSALRQALDRVARAVGLPALTNDDLDRYLSAVPGSPSRLSLHALIRTRTGMDAEALTDWLQSHLDIRDRSYHFKKYPACFLGTEAVRYMGQHFQLSPQEAVETGQALQTLGWLYHVAHEQAFADATLFFRLRAPTQLQQVDLGRAWQTLRDRLGVADRSHLGKEHPNCWIGQDAVELLCAEHAIARHESQLVLHRLMQFGLFEHVVGKHGFIDGNYFYRFTDSLA